MDENGIVIRRSKTIYLPFLTIIIFFIVVLIVAGVSGAHNFTDTLLCILLLAGVAALLAFYLLRRKDIIDIAISHKGIYLDGMGLYPWSLIESFSTKEMVDDGVVVKLILHFSQYEDEEFNLSHVAISREELVDHMLYYKGIYATYYKGHLIIK